MSRPEYFATGGCSNAFTFECRGRRDMVTRLFVDLGAEVMTPPTFKKTFVLIGVGVLPAAIA